MFLHYLKSLFQLILSPGSGWEDIRHADNDPRSIANVGLYPLIALAALSVFVNQFWDGDITFLSSTIGAIVTFVMFFAAYFIGIFLVSLIVAEFSDGANMDKRVHTFVNYSIGLLTLMQIISNLIPIELPLIYFFPLYVAVIQWKANDYLKIPYSKAGKFVLFTAPAVLLPPYLLYMLFNQIVL
ncbi:MAG: hypothetical protein J1E84_07695 [Muribaculaceae bacterium]|nr:hypothetical protein [Muribaculaceae bacterium]